MYRILLDGNNAYYQGDPDYTAYDIELDLQMGDSGTLKFTIPNSNPAWGSAVTRRTLVTMKLDEETLFEGWVRQIDHDMLGGEAIEAVGELSWLYDSVQPQAEFHDITVRNFLSTLLSVHNAQCPEHQFRIGIVDVKDSNDSLYRFTNREQTLDCIRDKLVDRLGGYLKVRKANGVRYLDYVNCDTYGTVCSQQVRIGENLLDYADNYTVEDICSSVVPLGCRLENDATNSKIGNLEQRLTVESVNGGRDYVVNDALVSRFGNVRTVNVWDDVTVPANLLAKAQEWLQSEQYERMHVTVKAVDLSLVDGQFDALRMGDRAEVVAESFGMRRVFPIMRRTYHPDDPSSDVIELGTDVKLSYVAAQVKANKSLAAKSESSEYQQTQWLTEAIENVTAMMTGDRGGYKLTEYDSDGRWLADYILDSPNKSSAKIVRKVNMNGTAYSTKGINGPYETAIMANGTILGKYIQAHSIKAEQISQDYTKTWEDADTKTLNTARTEFKAADAEIVARVAKAETTAAGIRTDLQAEIKVRADQISQTVKRGQINSAISQTAETIYIKSNKFGWESTNSSLATDGTLTAKNATFTNCTVNGNVTTEQGNLRTVVNQGGISYYYKAKNNWLSTGKIIPNYSVVNNTTTYTGLLRIASTKGLGLIDVSDYAVSLASMDKSSAATKQAGVGTSYSGGVAQAYMNTWNSTSSGSALVRADGASLSVVGKGTSSPPSTGVALTKNTVSIHANSGSSSSHAEMSIANGEINFYQDGMSAYTGSIYLTYGNGGKIYLTVKGGLIYGWTV